MRCIPLARLALLFLCLIFAYLIIFWKFYDDSSNKSHYFLPTLRKHKLSESTIKKLNDQIIITLVVCDSRFNESLNVIKSVLVFTKTPVRFVIFGDDDLLPKFSAILTEWKMLTNNQLHFELQKIHFPESHVAEWMNLFSKCSAQRLFIPTLLPDVDAVLYVDVDTLFLGPVDHLWDEFSYFNESQIAALALEDENPNVSWYPRFAMHPFYGKCGLNSGVMLMNLTRMREFGWSEYMTPVMLQWKQSIPWGDQDIINIVFHWHGGAVRELPARYNYRADSCMYGGGERAAPRGVLLLHGSRRVFTNDHQPAFRAVYRAVSEHALSAPAPALLARMLRYYRAAPSSPCAHIPRTLFTLPAATIRRLYGARAGSAR